MIVKYLEIILMLTQAHKSTVNSWFARLLSLLLLLSSELFFNYSTNDTT